LCGKRPELKSEAPGKTLGFQAESLTTTHTSILLVSPGELPHDICQHALASIVDGGRIGDAE